MSAVSLKYSSASEGGGLVDNVDVEVGVAEFVMWDYDGNGPATPALHLEIEDEGGVEHHQYYSAGRASDWEPSANGEKLEAVGRASSLNKQSNFMFFMKHLIEAGFPEDQIDDDISVLEGLKCHMVRVPAPERKGLPPRLDKDGNKKVTTVLVVDEIHGLPKEIRGNGKGTEKGSKKADPLEDILGPGGEGEDVNLVAYGAVKACVQGKDKGVTKRELAGLVFDYLDQRKDAKEIAQMVFQDDFLAKEEGWRFDKKIGIVSA
jgi:hypothetical protein